MLPLAAHSSPPAPLSSEVIRILDWSAQAQQGKVLLSWRLSEPFNGRWIVQRSTNKNQWENLQEGSTQQANTQNYTDDNPPKSAKLYYRLVLLNEANETLDLKEEEVRLLSFSGLETLKTSVYQGFLVIELELSQDAPVSIEILDTERNRVFVQQLELKAGQHEIPISTKNLNEGFYLLEVLQQGQLLKKNIQINKP
jgi:hypothetical protein